MARNSLRVWMWALGLAFAAGCHDATGNTGSGGSGSGGSGSGGDAGTHPELCSAGGTCTDGKVTGSYGHYCVPLAFTCEFGCRNPAGGIPDYSDDDGAIARSLVDSALCEPGDGSVAPPADALPADDAVACQPQLINGADTGLETCPDGTTHRRKAVTCSGTPGAVTGGHCWRDGDCSTGSICLCNPPAAGGGQCTPAGCATESDCPAGQGCIATVRANNGNTCAPAGLITYDCQTPDDTCLTNADCGDTSSTPRECRLSGSARVCSCKLI